MNARIEKLTATHGKPDPVTRRSDSAVWLILVDKSTIVEPGVVDVFYFCKTSSDWQERVFCLSYW